MPSMALSLLTAALALVAPAFGDISRRAESGAGLTTLSNNSAAAWPGPSANGGYAWASAFSRAQSLVSQMTLEEKITLITGQPGRCVGMTGAVERLGVPALCLEDGPAGVRPVQGVSQFPAGQAVAATWDRELIYQRGYAMGKEFFDQGVNIALGPVTGGPLGRSPRGGRNFEGFFDDAYATGEAAYMTVRGMQDSGVLATAKHYIGYEQETFRDPFNQSESYDVFPVNEQTPISSNIDNKALHELYCGVSLKPSAPEQATSYNEVNQTHSCANAYTLNNLLKARLVIEPVNPTLIKLIVVSQLNFQGGVMSDWGGDWGDADFINGGLDMSMPGVGFGGIFGPMWGQGLIPLIENGTIAESRVDDAAIRTLTPWIFSGQPAYPPPAVTWNADPQYYETEDAYWRDVRQVETMTLIRQIGEDSATLLKNTNNALPLRAPKVIAIVGSDAGPNELGALDGGGSNAFPTWNLNGTLTLGGGSGWAIPPYVVTPYEAISYRGRTMNSQVYAIFNDTAYDAVNVTVPSADVALVFVSAFTREGEDRATLYLDNDDDTLIQTVAANCNNTIVVMHAGGPVLVEAWIDNPNVTAVIAAHFPGQEAGTAITNVLFGDVSPSGKLPYTIGYSLDDYAPDTIVATPVLQPQAYFNESTLIDYRWFSANNITPRFEFGYGLSYSTFAYSSVYVQSVFWPDTTSVQQTHEPFEAWDGSNSIYDVIAQVTAQVTNTGDVVASETAELYATLPGSPGIWLRGFDKLKAMAPGETRAATFPLRRKDLSLWSTERQLWYIPEGEIQLQVGASSTKLYLTTSWSQ
ncbi:glycoside hydrolase [Fomitopsis serialis]|uniref:glycoside hydrolase n=1 Tax=Fomitopsis serialis TaxID=139415 RepID=UPI002008CF0E|nr:glycoside hydrolase [Neoantrodia serialis]KAH9932207.1 glycoside hydrolase [Neoantrodia serialis]